jgi:hypothetical protein
MKYPEVVRHLWFGRGGSVPVDPAFSVAGAAVVPRMFGRFSVIPHFRSSAGTAAIARSNGHAPNQAIQLTASSAAIYALGCLPSTLFLRGELRRARGS